MQIQFLYFEDCPSHEQALARLRETLTHANITAPIEIIKVETDEQAQRLRFPGSPTILINGEDLFPTTSAIYGLSCRAYQLPNGRISPLPSVEMLEAALQQAITATGSNDRT